MISKCDDLCGSSGCDSLVWSIQTCVYTAGQTFQEWTSQQIQSAVLRNMERHRPGSLAP